jgi:FMN phosphatase YigB (HAD superfamily)
MIKNIVFDLGDVLLEFKPERYLERKFSDPAKCRRLYEAIFQSDLWIELDRGTVTAGEAMTAICRRCPGLKKDIELVFSDWESILIPIEGTVSILEELKRAEFQLYALSNFHLSAFEKVYRRYHFFKLFDGLVISAKIKRVKPEPEIYQYLLEKYSLKAGRLYLLMTVPQTWPPHMIWGSRQFILPGPLNSGKRWPL